MLNWNTDDTICAIASGHGAGLRGIVRLSGPQAITIGEALTRPQHRKHQCSHSQQNSLVAAIEYQASELFLGERLGWIEADTYWWRTARSYTGQTAVEFHLLGSLPLLERLLAECCSLGARVAQPGEFTLRAFLAGRMDLSQAEAVLGVINARGEFELHRALDQLAGGLAKPVAKIRTDLIHALAHLEAGLDFVDEDIEFISATELENLLQHSLDQIETLQQQIETRNVSFGSSKIVLVGRPNAGKSSLFNALIRQDRAIVSEQRGTTRDYVAAPLGHDNLDLELVDTAGLDDSLHSEIDVESQLRTKSQMQQAALVVHVIDAACDVDDELAFIKSSTDSIDPSRRLIVVNKLDVVNDDVVERWKTKLAESASYPSERAYLFVSTRTKSGIHELKELLVERVESLTSDEGLGMLPTTAQRCRDSLQRCATALEGAIQMTRGIGMHEELVAAEIRLAMEELGWIAGEVYTDDLLDRIFSQFCIGK
jgi:tRNA modification GTPase